MLACIATLSIPHRNRRSPHDQVTLSNNRSTCTAFIILNVEAPKSVRSLHFYELWTCSAGLYTTQENYPLFWSPYGNQYAIISEPAMSAITPLLACSRLTLLMLSGCSYFLFSIALSQRLFRPRARAAYNSRSRCCHSCSRARLGDTRYDKNRIRSDPL